MKVRFLALAVVATLLAGAPIAAAQTGEIFGKVTDTSAGVMPGVTITLTSPVLLQPQVAVTSETGTYRFPQLAIGVYTVQFELPGFKTVVRDGIRIEIGFNAQINATMEISSVEETITVSGESPVVDTRDTSKTTRFTQEALQGIPSSRDPWTIIEQSAGVAMDRQNVGGSASGQQSNFVARGAAFNQQKWNLDGVDITDMSATGSSPVYYDFDAFEEMQITTGGADVTMQSPGVGVNLVTKSGTDVLRGSGRFYVTDEALQSQNVTDTLRQAGASSGNPIQNIKDYGLEAGGPIKRGRAWFWGSYGKQNVNVGINNFYKADASCQAIKGDPLAYPLDEVNKCLNTDQTILNNYNAKVAVELFKNNQFSMFFNGAEKVRNARDASDLRPLETTYRQMGVTRTDLGSNWWKTGMPKTYKWSDRHIFSDRFLMEFQYAHVGNNFTLTFHEDGLRDVQPSFETTTSLWGRSYQESVYVRPTDTIDVTGSYFMPGWLGGDHALKFGLKVRNDIAHTEGHWGGNAYARLRNGAAYQAQMYRDSFTEYGLHNRSLYAQDSYSKNKLTVNLGLRFDYQTDFVNPASVTANPFYGQATYAGVYNGVTYTGQPFNQLPAMDFGGADAGVSFKNFSPRVGLTYDLTGDGRNVLKANFSRYAGQIGTGSLASVYSTTSARWVRYPWVDLNHDLFIQANEIVLTSAPISWSSGYDYNNPSLISTTGTIDPDVRNEYTNEFIVGFDRQLGNDFAVGASYIYRRYGNFRWDDTPNWDSSNYEAISYTPTCTVAGARCETITYYQPTSQIPVEFVRTNRPDYYREYNGFELTVRKRMSKNWMLNGGLSYNDAPVTYKSAAAYEDPTAIAALNGAQYAQESTSSGLGNVFVNARWIFRLSGAYILPWQEIGVAAFYNARQGYPFTQEIQTPSRPFGAGQTDVRLDKMGDNRLPNFQTIDFRVDKSFLFASRVRLTASMDVFNLLNANTELSIRGRQNASNANQISSILAPRVLRFGVRATW